MATLFITQEYLHGNDGIDCHGNIVDPNIEKGLDWMADHFDEIYTAATMFNHPYYGLYGIERIGAASGRKYFKDIDWYKNGANYLVSPDLRGAVGGMYATPSFALLFLVRGRAPVVMNKLQYDIDLHGDKPPSKEGNWNERPRDVANLTTWIGKQNERFPQLAGGESQGPR